MFIYPNSNNIFMVSFKVVCKCGNTFTAGYFGIRYRCKECNRVIYTRQIDREKNFFLGIA